MGSELGCDSFRNRMAPVRVVGNSLVVWIEVGVNRDIERHHLQKVDY